MVIQGSWIVSWTVYHPSSDLYYLFTYLLGLCKMSFFRFIGVDYPRSYLTDFVLQEQSTQRKSGVLSNTVNINNNTNVLTLFIFYLTDLYSLFVWMTKIFLSRLIDLFELILHSDFLTTLVKGSRTFGTRWSFFEFDLYLFPTPNMFFFSCTLKLFSRLWGFFWWFLIFYLYI